MAERAELREREITRRQNRATNPLLGSPFESKLVGVNFVEGYPDLFHDIAERMARPSKAEYHELTRSYPNFGGEMAQMYAENDYERVMEEGPRVTEWVTIHREPDNEHDPNAVRIDWQGQPLGHLTRVTAARMAPELDAGITWLAFVKEVLVQPGMEEQPGIVIRFKRDD